MDFSQIGRWLIYVGIGFAITGLLFVLLGRIGTVKQFPGTLNFQIGGLTCTFPVILSILLSVVLTVVLNLIGRFLNR